MRGQELSHTPHPHSVTVVEHDDAGPDFDLDDRAFTIDEWGLWLTRLAKRAGRGRVDDRRACRLAIVGNAGVRAAALVEEREHKRLEREHLIALEKRLEAIQSRPHQPMYQDIGADLVESDSGATP